MIQCTSHFSSIMALTFLVIFSKYSLSGSYELCPFNCEERTQRLSFSRRFGADDRSEQISLRFLVADSLLTALFRAEPAEQLSSGGRPKILLSKTYQFRHSILRACSMEYRISLVPRTRISFVDYFTVKRYANAVVKNSNCLSVFQPRQSRCAFFSLYYWRKKKFLYKEMHDYFSCLVFYWIVKMKRTEKNRRESVVE